MRVRARVRARPCMLACEHVLACVRALARACVQGLTCILTSGGRAWLRLMTDCTTL